MKKCNLCKKKYPNHLVNIMATGAGYKWICLVCALKIKNDICGLPKKTPFKGTIAKQFYKEALKFIKIKKEGKNTVIKKVIKKPNL